MRISPSVLDVVIPSHLVRKAFVTFPELIEATGKSRNTILRMLHRLPYTKSKKKGRILFPTRLIFARLIELDGKGNWRLPKVKAAKSTEENSSGEGGC